MGKRKMVEEQHEEESKHAEVEQDEEALKAEKKRKKREKKGKQRQAEEAEETKEEFQAEEEEEQQEDVSEKKKKKEDKRNKEMKLEDEEAAAEHDGAEAEDQNGDHDSTVKSEQAAADDDDDNFDFSSLKRANKNHASSADTSSSSSAAPAVQSATRIFIGNLPFKITDDLLHSTFSHCGTIEGIHWVTDKATGKFYGSAFIDFASHTAIPAALELNNTTLLSRPIKVGVATGRQAAGQNRFNNKQKNGAHLAAHPISEKPPGTTTVFLGNLSFDVTEEVVVGLFKDCGEVKQVRWVEKDGVFKGCGFVEFEETEATDLAIKLNGREVLGRPMRVDYSGNTNRGEA